ncbi:hypothetical protein BGZ83_003036 [Gryganskiella cystojenkinii]|nr:hypothetical protein BGZ83_003036 [Gryganskiella cystojenkinii]
MTAFIVQISSAVLAIVCAVQAVPLDSRCVGSECNKSLSTSNVNLGSATNVVPVTNVMPITRYQPIVQAFAPVVQSEENCDEVLPSTLVAESLMNPEGRSNFYGGNRMISDNNLDRFSDLGDRFRFMNRMGYLHRGDMDLGLGLNSGLGLNGAYAIGTRNMNAIGNPVINNSGFISKRRIMSTVSNAIEPECVPSETQTCEQSLPVSTTNMGSMVTAVPSNKILPSTVYQGHVQSKEAQVLAAPVQHSVLKQSNVDLGSNTMVQPITKVIPHTTYQPEVDQKATMVEMAPQQDMSLDRSSVNLGSSVTIRPTTTIEPLTIFQPKIESLPFIIHDEACVEDVQPECSSC